MRAPSVATLGAVLVLPLALACGGAARDPGRETLEALRSAAEARDAVAFSARLSDTFRGMGGMTKADATAMLRRYFAAYESATVTLHDVEVEVLTAGANARCAVEFSGQGQKAFGLGGLLPGEAVYRFALELVDEGGTYRVREASWEAAALAEP
jgi:hypothetical protein